jgi:hypothetical protein
MRKAAKQIAVTAVLLLALCIVFRLVFFNQFSVYAPLPEPSGAAVGSADIRPRVERPEVLRAGEAEIQPGYMRIPVYPESAGETDFYPAACVPCETDEDGTIVYTGKLDVYHVQIIDYPEGYSCDESFEMYTPETYGEWILRLRKD